MVTSGRREGIIDKGEGGRVVEGRGVVKRAVGELCKNSCYIDEATFREEGA